MRPLPFDLVPLALREVVLEVFFALEELPEDLLLARVDDPDLDPALFAALLPELLPFAPPLFEALPLAVDARDDPDFDPVADFDAVDREEPEALDAPVRADPALDAPVRDPDDFDAVVFFDPELADDALFVDFEDEVPDLDRDPAEDFVPPDFEFDDFDPPDLELPVLDEADFDVEDFLVVGIFYFLRLLESEIRFDRILSKQHSTRT